MAALKRFDARQSRPAVSTEILDRQPPRSLEAERGVLGSMLLMPDVCDDVALVAARRRLLRRSPSPAVRHMLGMHDEGRGSTRRCWSNG